jgi:hypothetical protein
MQSMRKGSLTPLTGDSQATAQLSSDSDDLMNESEDLASAFQSSSIRLEPSSGTQSKASSSAKSHNDSVSSN